MARHFSKRRKTIARVCASLLLSLVSAECFGAQGGKKAQPFVLNPAKPYAYIEFDHAGKRAPLGRGESKYGYWLRLVNNCRLPIAVTVYARNYPNRGVGIVLFDEVVKIQPMSVSALPAKEGSGCPVPSGEPPEGYSKETGSGMDVEPGKSLLFSIPSNQLSPGWYVRIKFNLDINPESPVDQPDSYVEFDWWHLPESIRRQCR